MALSLLSKSNHEERPRLDPDFFSFFEQSAEFEICPPVDLFPKWLQCLGPGQQEKPRAWDCIPVPRLGRTTSAARLHLMQPSQTC